jgi:tryptophan-rich hypothetical protein
MSLNRFQFCVGQLETTRLAVTGQTDLAYLQSLEFRHGPKNQNHSHMNPLNQKKLLLTKWTAVKPVARQKHFLVSRVIQPELATDPIESVEIEDVFSKAVQVIAWRELQDDSLWRQGWI